jgi:hypothetical protein
VTSTRGPRTTADDSPEHAGPSSRARDADEVEACAVLRIDQPPRGLRFGTQCVAVPIVFLSADAARAEVERLSRLATGRGSECDYTVRAAPLMPSAGHRPEDPPNQPHARFPHVHPVVRVRRDQVAVTRIFRTQRDARLEVERMRAPVAGERRGAEYDALTARLRS